MIIALWLKFKGWIIAIASAVAAVIGIYFYGKKSGSLQEAQRQQQIDSDTAREVEDAADRARKPIGDDRDDVIKRLSKHGQLRDKP